MNTAWFIGISEDKKKEIEDAIKSSTIVLRQLKKILETKLSSLDRIPMEDYNTPSWAYKEADRHGQLRVLKELLTIVN